MNEAELCAKGSADRQSDSTLCDGVKRREGEERASPKPREQRKSQSGNFERA